MFLKAVIGLGMLLMLAGFGAAGWQSWQNLPPQESMIVEEPGLPPDAGAALAQDRLMSASGGLVGREDVEAYLVQDRFVAGRTVEIVQTNALADLLVDGEKLPEGPYLQVLADIRAPKVAAGACKALQEGLAADCAVQSARVVAGSVDPAGGTADFRVVLVYTLKPSGEDMPALAERVFTLGLVERSFDAGAEGAGTVADMIGSAAAAVGEACAAQRRSEACRVMRMRLIWQGDGAGTATLEIGSLSPLPKGMYPVPPLG